MQALKTALLSQLGLIPWLSALGDDYLTFWLAKNLPWAWWVASSSHSASNEDSRVRHQPEVGRPVVAEARVWSLG